MAAPVVSVVRATTALAVLWPVSQAASQGSFQAPEPLRIGVGGDYADGLDGMLAARGLPRERVFPWELGDPEVLGRYDLLFLSCPAASPELDGALEAWVKAGGRAYIEMPRWGAQPPLPAYVVVGEPAPKEADAAIIDEAFALGSGLPTGTPINLYDLVGVLLRPQPGVRAGVLARFCPDQGGDPVPGGEALMACPLGAGELVFSGPTLAFACFRGEATQPLLGAAIAHLVRGRGVPRLTVSAPEAPDEPDAAPVSPAESAPGAAPAGFEPGGTLAGNPYNVLAQLSAATSPTGPATLLLLDGQADPAGKALGPSPWLAFGAKHIELREGTTDRAVALATATWALPTEPVDVLVKRRASLVSVLLGDREVLRASVKARMGGLVAAKAGLVPLTEPYCQEVAEPVLFDDFMREPDDPSEWTPLGGEWSTVGIGDGQHSVNGFFLRGRSDSVAVNAAGDWFWEDYTVSAAVRPEDAAACGLVALRRKNGEGLAFVVDSAPRAWPTARLVRTVGGRETLLAAQTGRLAQGQWHRLALRVQGAALEGLVDGEVRVRAQHSEVRSGGIGLLVQGGAARFDDVAVQPAREPIGCPRGEGTSTPAIPSTIGAEDHLTWANPAARWLADSARPSLLRHQGDFPGDVTVSLALEPVAKPAFRRLILAPAEASPESAWAAATVQLAPGTATATVEVTAPGLKPVRRQAPMDAGAALRLTRERGVVRALWGAEVLCEAAASAALRRVALEVDGPPVTIRSVRVEAPTARDYVFGAAPTDWHSSCGTWEVAARWACDDRWSWFAGWAERDAAVWNKRPIPGDVTVDYYVGVKMEAPGGDETERCRDLNTVLCGDRRDPRSGYSLILGGDGGVKTRLLRNGVAVAEAANLRVPSGFGVHQEWFHIRAARLGSRVELDLEGRPVFRWEDPDPLPGGHVGVWTHNSGLVISRVTIYS